MQAQRRAGAGVYTLLVPAQGPRGAALRSGRMEMNSVRTHLRSLLP